MQEYNRGVRKTLLIAAAALLSACSRDIQNSDAVRAGVLEYLTSNQSRIGLDPNAMQVDVTSVSFQKDEARATVAFRAKGGGDSGAMMINYVLDRKGNKWVVKGRTENGVNPHGAGALPQAAPELPPGHPSTGAAPDGKQLPPGHPPVGSKQ
jgi:hypothetical protein